MSVRAPSYLAAAVALLALATPASALGSTSLTLRVHADGYVQVAQVLTADSKATSLQVPLLAPMISDPVATDQNGSLPLNGFSSGRSNTTVYVLGASQVDVRYDTYSLTAKNGTAWTVAFNSIYNSTLREAWAAA